MVQPSTYGTDNRCLLDALSQFGPDARGIAAVADTVTDSELQNLHEAGVRGLRFNLEFLVGLTAGADDYIVKPFDTLELVARVRTTLRRYADVRSVSPLTGLPGNHRIDIEIATSSAFTATGTICASFCRPSRTPTS